MNVHIEHCGETDTGNVRSSNEDQLLIADVRCPVKVVAASTQDAYLDDCGPTGTLMAVADGMGGHAMGATASTIAIRCLRDYVADHWHDFVVTPDAAERPVSDHLTAAFEAAHEAIVANSLADRECRGMGTTLTVTYVRWPRLYVAHAGDSRCYLLRGSDIKKLTTDQTLGDVAEEAHHVEGAPPPDPDMYHVLYNCLGADAPSVEVQTSEHALNSNDALLLCSDGLTNHVQNDKIVEIIWGRESIEAICEELIDTANEAGGKDNIAVVVARCQHDDQETKRSPDTVWTKQKPESPIGCDSTADTIPTVSPASAGA